MSDTQSRTAREEELMIEIERLKAWLYRIKNRAYMEVPSRAIEWLAEEAIRHANCAAHTDWGSTEDFAKLGKWP